MNVLSTPLLRVLVNRRKEEDSTLVAEGVTAFMMRADGKERHLLGEEVFRMWKENGVNVSEATSDYEPRCWRFTPKNSYVTLIRAIII